MIDESLECKGCQNITGVKRIRLFSEIESSIAGEHLRFCAGKPHTRFDDGVRQRNRLNLSLLYRRAEVSEPSNIAEGCGRNSDKELIRFLHISVGLSVEVDTQLIFSESLGFINANDAEGFQLIVEACIVN